MSCLAKDAAFTLKSALLRRELYQSNEKPVIRTDNGPQFVAWNFEKAYEQVNMKHERIPCATPNMVAHIESFHSILEDEFLSRNEFKSFAEAYKKVTEYIHFYNNTRIHSGLK